jgi:hypothetical protein
LLHRTAPVKDWHCFIEASEPPVWIGILSRQCPVRRRAIVAWA